MSTPVKLGACKDPFTVSISISDDVCWMKETISRERKEKRNGNGNVLSVPGTARTKHLTKCCRVSQVPHISSIVYNP
jgi:hypothetical protein